MFKKAKRIHTYKDVETIKDLGRFVESRTNAVIGSILIVSWIFWAITLFSLLSQEGKMDDINKKIDAIQKKVMPEAKANGHSFPFLPTENPTE